MLVFRRGNSKVYHYRFVYDGKVIQRSTKQRDKDAAAKIASAEQTRLTMVDAGLEPPTRPEKGEPHKIKDFLDQLEAFYRSDHKLNCRNLSLLNRARREFGDISVDGLDASTVDDYIETRQSEGDADASINRVTQLVLRSYTLAVENKHIKAAQVPHIRRLDERENVRTGFFTAQEMERVLARLPDDGLRDFVRFGYLVGWRKGSIASLKWEHIDLESGEIDLPGMFTKTGKPLKMVVEREDEAAQLLSRRYEARKIKTANGPKLSALVFHRGDGEPIGEFKKAWATACVAAGVGTMVCGKCGVKTAEKSCKTCKRTCSYSGKIFHDLRRTAARDLIRSGVARSIAMKILGHSTESIFERYNITNDSDFREASVSLRRYREEQKQKVVAIGGK